MRLGVSAVLIGAGSCLLVLGGGVQARPFLASGDYATPAAAAAPVQFEVFLPLRDAAGLDALLARQQERGGPDYHHWLTPEQFKARFGPTAASMSRAEAALRTAGFTVADVHTRSFGVTGTAGAVARTFSAPLLSVQPRQGAARLVGATDLVMPAGLKAEGAVVLAFDGLPPARPHLHVVGPHKPQNRTSATGPYWYTDLKQAYDYPSYQAQVNGHSLDGTGVTVAVLMEHDVQQSDIDLYFDHENFTYGTGGKPDPTVVHLKVAGGSPYSAEDSVEASLDVEQVLGGAPGARVSLVNLPDLSDAHVSAGYRYIVDQNKFDIVSSSFGSCELLYGPDYSKDNYQKLDVYDTLFKQGAAQGITFIASSGDSGGLGCPEAKYFAHQSGAKFVAGVESPADDPNVTAVGGGNLVTTFANQSYDSAYVRESANGDPEQPYDPYGLGLNVTGGYFGAGGGLSAHFPRPSYQDKYVTSPYRAVPDVGMFVGGCPDIAVKNKCSPDASSAVVSVGGAFYDVIGTSVAAPEFAGAVALYEQSAGRQGDLNPFLYAADAAQSAKTGPSGVRHPATGFDGSYTAKQPRAAYSYIYGVGSPKVRSLFGYGQSAPAEGPGGPSNP